MASSARNDLERTRGLGELVKFCPDFFRDA